MRSRTYSPVKGEPKGLSIRPPTVVQRKSNSGRIPEEWRRNRQTLQRRAVNDDTVSEVPPIVHEVLRPPGQPLDPATRAFFEPRFGHDFSQVRVHTDGKAAESTKAVNGLAYTVGRDVVFGPGQFTPQTGVGRKLLAHELTHVLQQGNAANGPLFFGITAPHDVAEQEAHANARSIDHGLPVTRATPTHPVLARYVPAEAEPEAEVEVEPEPAEPPVGSSGGAHPVPGQTQHRAYQGNPSFYKMYERAKQAPNYDAARDELERPVATLDRGGAAPDFVTVSPKEESVPIKSELAGEAGNITVRFKPHWFHILDAIEYDVANVYTGINTAFSKLELMGIYAAYFPDSFRELALNFANVVALPQTQRDAESRTRIRKHGFVVFQPSFIDPGGVARMTAFRAAAKRDPKVMEALKEILGQPHELPDKPEPGMRGPCEGKEVPRGSSDHDKYAFHVTKSPYEFHINAPNGIHCRSDGRDAQDPTLLWEVKTLHDWVTEAGLSRGSLHSTYIQERVMRLEAQRAECLEATKRCGYKYAYAFDDETVARTMKKYWGNVPPVHFIKPP